MRKITKTILKLFIAYFVFWYVMGDHTRLYPGRSEGDYFFKDTLLLRTFRPFYYRNSKISRDYFPYVGPNRRAKLKYNLRMTVAPWPGGKSSMEWAMSDDKPWSGHGNYIGENNEMAAYCDELLDANKFPPPGHTKFDKFELTKDVFLMPQTELAASNFKSTSQTHNYFSETYFINSLSPLIVTIAPVLSQAGNVYCNEATLSFSMRAGSLRGREYIISNRIPSHKDLLWFSPDMDAPPQPLEKVSEDEQRIKVPWGWLVYKKETVTRTIKEGLCPEREDRTYQVDYWQVYAEKEDYYEN